MKINDKEGGCKDSEKKRSPPPSFILSFLHTLFAWGKSGNSSKAKRKRTSTVFNAMSVVINICVVIEERVLNLCILGIKSTFKGIFFFPTSIRIPRHSVEVMGDFIFHIFSLYNVYFCKWYFSFRIRNKCGKYKR